MSGDLTKVVSRLKALFENVLPVYSGSGLYLNLWGFISPCGLSIVVHYAWHRYKCHSFIHILYIFLCFTENEKTICPLWRPSLLQLWNSVSTCNWLKVQYIYGVAEKLFFVSDRLKRNTGVLICCNFESFPGIYLSEKHISWISLERRI